MAKIKAPYDEKMRVVRSLIDEYEKELGREVPGYNNKFYRGTRKARLNRIRLELHEQLMDIETHYPVKFHEEVTENDR